ncbi:MAG: glycosyltransferase [Candidatus Cryptobacteroides sp.]
MQILQLGKFYPVRGGVEKVMYDLATGLSEGGVRCDMMCAASEGGTRVQKLNDNADLIQCRTLRKVAATMIAPSMILELRRRCGRYDIIHIHHPDPMAALALWLSGYKGQVVLHWHSDILKQKFLLRFFKPLQDWLIRRADLIIGTTLYYLEQSPWLTQARDKFVPLHIGIDPVLPEAAEVEEVRKRYPGKKIVFSLGRLVEYKGFSYLLDAAEFLPDDYVILIGGSGPLEGELKSRIGSKGLEEKVRLLGHIPDESLPAYYGACTLFVLSSVQKTEAFGIVQIEAMSCGKPVVATKIPGSGVSKVNADGVSGINVEPQSAEGLAAAIKAVSEDREVYRNYSEGASRRFNSLFTREKMISDCLAIYEKLRINTK